MLAREQTTETRGQSERLAAMCGAALSTARCAPAELGAVAVTTGPGSFTGLRAAMSLAEGFARARRLPLLGISVQDALQSEWRATGDGRPLWVAIHSRADRLFLCRGELIEPIRVRDVPFPAAGLAVAIAGDAAEAVALELHGRGAEAGPTSLRRPDVEHVARIAAERLARNVMPEPVLPIYIDPPEARRASVARPAPQPMPATLAHAEAMAAIHAASFPPRQQWDAAALATLLSQPGTFAEVDPSGGFVLARVAGDEAEVLTIAVVPEARRQGRARALMFAAQQRARRLGAAVMFLEVGTANAAARALYNSLGFSEAGCRRAYYADGTDALLLRCMLSCM